jgi:hypothetical protein
MNVSQYPRIDKVSSHRQRGHIGEDMANNMPHEKREYVRALISTKAKIARIDPAQVERLSGFDEAMVPVTTECAFGLQDGSEQDLPRWAKRIAEHLLRIDEKLDRILEKLRCERSEVSPAIDATIIDISGSGIGLVIPEPLETGQLLQISMSLPGFPLNSFQAYGKVVRLSPRKGKDKGLFNAAVKLLYISEADQEQLIAYSFSAQRKAIRTAIEATPD